MMKSHIVISLLASNSSGLIHLTRLSKVSSLRGYAKQVLIPEAVHREVVEVGKREGYPEATSIEGFERDGWITIQELRPTFRGMARDLAQTLGPGEAEAIALAKQTNLRLLIDDDHGRRIARHYDVDTLSTLAIILEFFLAGEITKAKYVGNVRRFSSQAWIGPDVVEEFLRRMD